MNAKIIATIDQQIKSIDLWYTGWITNKDASSLKNLSFTLGNLSGMIRMADTVGIDLPPQTLAKIDYWANIFDSMLDVQYYHLVPLKIHETKN